MVSDYYAMLGVDPRADRPTIEAALEKCRHTWSSGTRNPKYKHAYQSYLDQIPEIRRSLLGDPTARAAYDSERAAEAGRTRDRALDELQRLVRLRAAKGGLTASDRDTLRNQATRLGLTSDDLDRLTRPIRAHVASSEPIEPDEVADDGLDPVTRRQVRAALDLVGKRDLYEALGLPRDATMAEVVATADRERQRWMRKSQVTAEKTAWLEVVSYAQSQLCQPAGRARYDRSLVIDAEEALGRSITFAIDGLNSLDPGTRSALINEAASLGIIPARVDRLLARACRLAGVARDGGRGVADGLGQPPSRWLRCRACGGIDEFDRAARDPDGADCRHCRESLRWKCPACGTGRWVDEARCSCGFQVRDFEPFLRHFEASREAYRSRDFEGALWHLARCQGMAPQHPGTRKAIEKVKATISEIETKRVDYETAFDRTHLLAAKAAIDDWAAIAGPEDPDLIAARTALSAMLREAMGFLARAKAIESTNPREARDAYRKAIAIAGDLAEAGEGLRSMPPDPPTGLIVSLEPDAIALRWTPPPPDGLGACSFRVIRKVGSTPQHPDDGTVVADVTTPEAFDRGVKAGQAVGYAVFGHRGGIVSPIGASAPPILMVRDVIDLRAEGSRSEIRLSWTLPEGATGAKVVVIGGSDRVVESLADHAVDRGLDENRIYRYRVSALFRTVDGKGVASAGVELAASPTVATAEAPSITIGHDPDGSVSIRWKPVDRGALKILRTDGPPPCRPGERRGSAEAMRFEGRWLVADRSDGATDPEPPAVGICYYTPFLFLNNLATAGTSAGYSSVPDPVDLRAVRAGGAGLVHLRWRWTPRATEAIVVAKAGAAPERPDDPGTIAVRVDDLAYSRQGYASIDLPTEAVAGPWHLAVFSVMVVEGRELTSPGLDPTSRTVVPGANTEITVSYVLRKPSFPGRPWSLSIQTDPPGASTPPLALVSHPRTYPLSPDDGQVIERFPAARDGTTFPVRPRVDLARHRTRLFADPDAGPTGSPPIRFRHPESSMSRA